MHDGGLGGAESGFEFDIGVAGAFTHAGYLGVDRDAAADHEVDGRHVVDRDGWGEGGEGGEGLVRGDLVCWWRSTTAQIRSRTCCFGSSAVVTVLLRGAAAVGGFDDVEGVVERLPRRRYAAGRT
ncbi:hypothetical protein [Phytohabitans aurantiacus]|uniref:hypothetical protein n=1 Tax=Phytohabitans aurantiacus TaxID=3016789 RepID=UPI00249330D8|nr:hypothetical protein [Phytohabitans aurantiacus]